MWERMRERLRGKLFLSSMMGITDGAFCAERGRGADMVQLGAYLAEPPAYGVPGYESILPADRGDCIRFLADQVENVKKRLDVIVCLNLATLKLEWGLEASDCFKEAGGDVVELNCHGGLKRYLKQGKLRAMVLPEHRSELFRWLGEFSKLRIPVIVKFRMGAIPDYTPILDELVDMNLLGVHFNIRDERSKRPDFEFVKKVKNRYGGRLFLLVSGYVRSTSDVRRLFEAGADMVGIAEPTIKDPDYIAKLAEELKGGA